MAESRSAAGIREKSTGVGGPPRSSCERCRERKVKCTGERPNCRRCEKTGKQCEYTSSHGITTVAALEQRVRHLEAQIQRLTPTAPVSYPSGPAPSPFSAEYDPSSSTRAHKRSRTQDVSDVDLLSMANHGSAESPDPGPGSIPISSDTQLLSHMPIDNDIVGEISRKAVRVNTHARARLDTKFLPPRADVDSLVHHYRLRPGATYPIFHSSDLLQQVDAVCSAPGECLKSDICLVLLVLAVAATSLSRNSTLYTDYRPRAKEFWRQSLKYTPHVAEHSGLKRLQVLLVRLQYVSYDPNEGNVWDLSGSAMRVAVELGLHRERAVSSGSALYPPLEEDMRRRLFWICYTFERNICAALGWPPAIPDEWINARFPSVFDDSLINPTGIMPREPSGLKTMVLVRFHLWLLHSEIHNRLYGIPNPSGEPPPKDWYDSVNQRISTWRANLPLESEFCNQDWADTKYHLTIILLYRPSPGNPIPNKESLTRALQSASLLMRAYRNLFRVGNIDMTWFTAYQLFIAGVTYLNAIWQASRSGWTLVESVIQTMLDVQGAMSILEAMAAITPGFLNIRNAFEAIFERILRFLNPPGTTNPLLPPSLNQDQLSSTTVQPTQGLQQPQPSVQSEGVNFDYLGASFEPFPSAESFDRLDEGLFVNQPGVMTGDEWDKVFGNLVQQFMT